MFKSIIKSAVVVASLALATSAIAKDKIRVGISPEAYPPFTSLNAKNQWEVLKSTFLQRFASRWMQIAKSSLSHGMD